MLASMPLGQPYGYLILEDSDNRQTFNLTHDESVIGRDPNCQFVLPERFIGAGKRHCQIKRGITGVELADLGSLNGTFMNGQQVKSVPIALAHGDRFTLGNSTNRDNVCTFRFELVGRLTLKPTSTESDSRAELPDAD